MCPVLRPGKIGGLPRVSALGQATLAAVPPNTIVRFLKPGNPAFECQESQLPARMAGQNSHSPEPHKLVAGEGFEPPTFRL
jgi:hypothetical protein